jgi:predicted NBD/HSP70 family sugar kinase
MRKNNAALLLRLLWTDGPLSRAELARRTGMSASTASDIINELRERELIDEQGTGASSGGRRPIMLGVRDERVHTLGVEIGATHITGVVTSFRGEVLCSRRVDAPTRSDAQATLEILFDLMEWCLDQPGVDRRALLGVGVAVPCPVDPADPGKLSRRILPNWAEVDLAALVSERYARPVHIENDANAGALAESWFGAHEDARDLAYVKVATGVGAGFIIDGRLYRGSGGTAGEIGHVLVDPRGEPCSCGSRGCLVTLIGTNSILARARDQVRTRDGSPADTIHDVVEATLDGDVTALGLVEEVGTHLGTALAGLLNLLNPRVVVLGGELTALRDLLLDPLRVSLRRQALFSSVARTQLLTSRLGPDSIAVGAAVNVLDAALKDLDLFPTLRTTGAA